MKIYLISSDYEGNANIAFSSQELAEEYLIANGGDDVLEVTLDGGYSFTYPDPTPVLVAHQEQMRLAQIKRDEEFRQWQDVQIHNGCGLTNRECQCWAETNCGEFGGITKKGTACLNAVLISNGERCYLHH